MVTIRDLSKYDPLPVPYGDYDGLIIRLFDGNNKDPLFETHKTGAKSANKPWWGYSFFNFLYPVLPQAQAVISILREDPGVFPVAWDVEEWGGHRYPPRDILLGYMQVLYVQYKLATGKICQFYLNPATIHYLKPIPGWLLQCLEWVAHWGVVIPDYEPWSKWFMHQYQGEPDLNRFNGSDDEYWTLVGIDLTLPELVRTTADVLNMRSTPMGTIIGHVPKGTLFGVDGEGYYNGVRWWRVGNAYVSSQWCEIVE